MGLGIALTHRRAIPGPFQGYPSQHRTNPQDGIVLRVIYFEGAVILTECLHVAMTCGLLLQLLAAFFGSKSMRLSRWGKGEMVSTIVFRGSIASGYMLVPLMDALSPAVVGPGLLRLVASIAALGKTWAIASCKSNTVSCNTRVHDFNWTVSTTWPMNTTTVNASDSVAIPERHVVFSTLDLRLSCDCIVRTHPFLQRYGLLCVQVAVLSLQILIGNLRSPGTTNVVKGQFKLNELHSETDGSRPGSHNVCSALFGANAGCALHAWLCKHVLWLACIGVVSWVICYVVHIAAENSATPVFAASLLAVPILVALCQQVRTLKKLVCTMSMWYYVSSISSGIIADTLTFGPRHWTVDSVVDSVRAGGYCAWEFSTALSLIIVLPVMDAVPPNLMSQQGRILFFAFVALFKSDLSKKKQTWCYCC